MVNALAWFGTLTKIILRCSSIKSHRSRRVSVGLLLVETYAVILVLAIWKASFILSCEAFEGSILFGGFRIILL